MLFFPSIAVLILLLQPSVSALFLSRRDSALSLPQCLFDNASGRVAAIVCSDQLNSTQVTEACQTGTGADCIWTFDYQGSQVTVCAKNAAQVDLELKMANSTFCVCGSTASFSSGQSTITIGGAEDSYSSEQCTGGFCPLWYGSQPSYTCSDGLPTLGDFSAATIGVIQAGVSSSQSGTALSGSATASSSATSSAAATTSATSTVTRTASTASQQQQSTSTGSPSSSKSFASTLDAPFVFVSFVVMAISLALYAP